MNMTILQVMSVYNVHLLADIMKIAQLVHLPIQFSVLHAQFRII